MEYKTRSPETAPKSMPLAERVLDRFSAHFSESKISFDIVMPDGSVRHFGPAASSFRVSLKSKRAVRALASLDEGRFGDAYVDGEIDIDGDMLAPFALRSSMADFHPLVAVWRFIQPALFGQVHTNRKAIAAHYDIDPDFFLSFLDPKLPCYTQGTYLHPEETLEEATRRKFDYCFDRLQLKPNDRILEIGPGWGAWFEYATRRGVKCTGISISQTSIDYLRNKGANLGLEWDLVLCDLLQYQTEQKYDAIVIMGVIEHLPQYKLVLDRFLTLLKPGKHVFLDGSACTTKYELSSYMVKYIYGGNHSFLVLHDFLASMAKTPFEVLEILNDRESYYLTFKQWATNFEANRDFVIGKFGDFNYRRFRLYLWGAAHEFLSRSLDCYRMILRAPQ